MFATGIREARRGDRTAGSQRPRGSLRQEVVSTKSSFSPSLTLSSSKVGRGPPPRFPMQAARCAEWTCSDRVSTCPLGAWPSRRPLAALSCILAILQGLSLFIIVATILLGSPLKRACASIHQARGPGCDPQGLTIRVAPRLGPATKTAVDSGPPRSVALPFQTHRPSMSRHQPLWAAHQVLLP